MDVTPKWSMVVFVALRRTRPGGAERCRVIGRIICQCARLNGARLVAARQVLPPTID